MNIHYRQRHTALWLICLAGLLLLLCLPFQAAADDFADYKTGPGTTAEVDLPTVAGGWFTAAEYFPDGTTEMIDDQFEAEGRIIAANNTSIYLQRTYGSSQWDVVGTISTGTMDPSFIHVSPDGSQIALGIGYGAPLLIIPTSILSISNPPVLDTHASVKKFTQISYYDGDWADNRYFVVNGGQWPDGCDEPYDEDPDCTFASGVGAIDTEDNDPSTHVGVPLIFGIPGGSGDVDVDSSGNLLTGLGWATGPPNRTGELKVWEASEWDPVNGSTLDYESNGKVVADNILSVAHIGEDAEGNLHIGGGDAFGTGGPSENGYAALVKSGIVGAIADGTRTTPVTDGDKVDNSEYKYFAPDPCQDDSATGALAGNWGRGLAVMWNPSGDGSGGCAGGPGSATDYWMPGVTPRLTVYYPGSAPDTDGDGIPDASDNAYLTANAGQQDTDGDGYGNIVDADLDNSGQVDGQDYNAFRSAWGSIGSGLDTDFNSDSGVDGLDYNIFRGKWNTTAPWY